ncbi:hypothetical protein MWU75_17375 [Ornithinimicrobium sp. F0845]|uniref:hypothetical protein n=1 Tax=Ornithinimicrobium sp. F0845 TaxID=2926412 RepID=UPI001FF507F7|nr:hypothetical protein [Ornithinimicrobium sp. F0845]MCK0113918.1 hypothetical protein [Ornithinimicrobium sp. F0845]
MPNSLIFAVILAVWAAYLIQHWIRRRDHVATARSVDRFSEAMRVLERRQSAAPRADLTVPAPKSYAVSLTRPAHPDVVVKRARHGAAEPAPRRARCRLPRPSAATLRAMLLVVGVLALAAGITLYSLAMAPWWAAAAGGAGLLLALTLIRISVGRQRRRATSPVRPGARRHEVGATQLARKPTSSEGPRSKATRRRGARPKTARRRSVRPAPRRSAAAATARASSAPAASAPTLTTADTAASAPVAAVARDAQFFDVEAHDRAESQAGAAAKGASTLPTAELQPGTWAPVPVPPPTYTLKARASRPGAPSSDPAQATATGAVQAESTGQVEDLPFDGHALAFDEEFEDLPPVHSVG